MGNGYLSIEYCRNGTLHKALHLDDEIHRKLFWSIRVRIALQAARALEYLHEVCHPPIVHQNFKSVNVLLDNELAVHISDCGLAPLMSSDSTTQSDDAAKRLQDEIQLIKAQKVQLQHKIKQEAECRQMQVRCNGFLFMVICSGHLQCRQMLEWHELLPLRIS